jgi:hypothetical protein
MKIRFFVFIILFGISNCFACKCYEYTLDENIKVGLKKADIIFYGELIKLDTIKNSYSFRIFELFKGNYKSKSITSYSESNCDFYFNEKGLCIIYGNFNKDKTLINVSACSPSQSQNFGPGFLPPPFEFDSNRKIISKNKIEMDLFNLENKNKSLQSFIYQLEKLRQYKQNQNTISENSKSDFYQKLLIVTLISNAILLLGLIVVIVKKKSIS